MTKVPPQPHPLRGSIAKHKIRRVAVVDDAFDAVSLASFQEGEAEEFFKAVNEDDSRVKEFHKLVSEKESDELLKKADLTDAAAKLLWEKRNSLSVLGPVLKETLFRVH